VGGTKDVPIYAGSEEQPDNTQPTIPAECASNELARAKGTMG
jgi:hypothetical protein